MIDAIAAHLDARMAGARSTQAELAALLGISRPRLNRLLAREVALFGLDSLAAIAMRAGLTVRLNAVRPYSRR
ncbi:MAG: transcriptional regulator [Betaproteobacteria bacterium]|nr:transcriptional regulator [Betaproteobacteria bacterium]